MSLYDDSIAAGTAASRSVIDGAEADFANRLSVAQNALQSAQQNVTAVTTERDKEAGDKAALEVLFVNLADEFERYKKDNPVPVPPAPKILYGMNVSPGTSWTNGVKETAADQVKRIVSTYGGLKVAKCFYQGGLPSAFNVTYEGLVPGKVVFVCFKFDQDGLAAGKYDAIIQSYLASIPEGWLVILVNWQEPDDEMWVPSKFKFTAAQHRAATEHLCDIVKPSQAYANKRVEVWECFMGFSLDAARFDKAAVSSKIDGILWDYYWNTPTDKWPAKTAVEDTLRRMAEFTKSLGIQKYGLAETGDNPHPNDVTGVGRAGHWKNVYEGARSAGYVYLTYFNAIGTTGDHRLLPGQPFSNATVDLLRTYA